jgi:hypothetical protein
MKVFGLLICKIFDAYKLKSNFPDILVVRNLRVSSTVLC